MGRVSMGVHHREPGGVKTGVKADAEDGP